MGWSPPTHRHRSRCGRSRCRARPVRRVRCTSRRSSCRSDARRDGGHSCPGRAAPTRSPALDMVTDRLGGPTSDGRRGHEPRREPRRAGRVLCPHADRGACQQADGDDGDDSRLDTRHENDSLSPIRRRVQPNVRHALPGLGPVDPHDVRPRSGRERTTRVAIAASGVMTYRPPPPDLIGSAFGRADAVHQARRPDRAIRAPPPRC